MASEICDALLHKDVDGSLARVHLFAQEPTRGGPASPECAQGAIGLTPLCADPVMAWCDPDVVDAPLAGRDYPGTLREFNAWFADEEACLDYLAALRWPSGFVCPGCGGGRAWRRQGVADEQGTESPVHALPD